MAKYSTGGISSDDEGSCELCGAERTTLHTERVAGATLAVCPDCRTRHAETGTPESERDEHGRETGTRDPDEPDRRQRAVHNTARMDDARSRNPSGWVDDAEYEGDPLPYLVRGYADRLANARAAADLGTADLAEELDASENDIIAIEEGRATSADVGGSLITAIETRLNITLTEQT
ncbi:helix-turn-helix domain-containing protein [Halocatena salina]|uniref:Multiprotein-bridging factor 1 family protein n=1 Tax=Halocatena salina TaxID=2934340 RepID=A0A8U0A3E0_9EURY|nr:multiprotein-bridging factor 1 family protein [Halocatena salina]UPM43701.1 multiprotein-bridging factor 1 family protein [Halocatena salina]